MNQRSCRAALAWLVAVALALTLPGPGPGPGPGVVHGQCQYEIVAEIIATPGCPPNGVAPLVCAAINDHNVVVGYFFPNCGFARLPFMWSEDTGFVPIPLPPGVLEAEARDINNHGEIVGWLVPNDLSGLRAFRYRDGVWTQLSATGGANNCEAFAINDDGWVCGYRDTSEGRKAFRWRENEIEELAPPSIGGAVANAINVGGTVAGEMSFSVGLRAFLWSSSQIDEIPSLNHTLSAQGLDINSGDSIVGSAIIRPPGGELAGRGWLFANNALVELESINGIQNSRAIESNDASQIVGWYSTPPNRAFLWQHGQMFDLESLILGAPPNLNLSAAEGINNTGHIVTSRFVIRPVNGQLGDVNLDCVVDANDLGAVLADWGTDKSGHSTDIVTSATFQPPGDGVVDGADLAIVLGNWSISTEAATSLRRR